MVEECWFQDLEIECEWMQRGNLKEQEKQITAKMMKSLKEQDKICS